MTDDGQLGLDSLDDCLRRREGQDRRLRRPEEFTSPYRLEAENLLDKVGIIGQLA
jgi:hypothetical protein